MITTSTAPDPRPRAAAWVGMPGEVPLPANVDALALAGWRQARRQRLEQDGLGVDELLATMRRRRAEDIAIRAELADLRRIVKAAGLPLPVLQGGKRTTAEPPATGSAGEGLRAPPPRHAAVGQVRIGTGARQSRFPDLGSQRPPDGCNVLGNKSKPRKPPMLRRTALSSAE